MQRNRVQQVCHIIAGLAIAIVLFVVLGLVYRIGRHSYRETDVISILGQRTACSWEDTEPLVGGRGLVVTTPLVASAPLGIGEPPKDALVVHMSEEGIRFVSLTSGGTVLIEAELASRSIVNRFGTELFSWRCTATGKLVPADNSFYLLVTATGGGDAGATVTFDVQHQRDSKFVLTVVERLWSAKTRRCVITFMINEDGEISMVEKSA